MFLADNNLTSWLIPISLGLLLGFLIATRKQNNFKNIVVLSPEEFRANMRKGQLIDIRTEKEFQEGRINGSRNFPKKSAFSNLTLLRRDLAVFLYANKDTGLIKTVAKKFIKKDFSRVYILKGGFEKWDFTIKK